MSEPVRLIAMDMDGTLLGRSPTYIPRENADALRRAAERGIALALCSGRVLDDAAFFAQDAGLPMHVLGLNGCCRADEPLGPIVSSHAIDPQISRRIKRLLDDAGLLYGIYGAQSLVIRASWEEQRDAALLWGTFIGRVGDRTVVSYRGEHAGQVMAQGVCKFVAIEEDDHDRLYALRDRLMAEVPEVDVTSSWVNNIEIIPRGMNKGKAIASLAADLGIPMSQVMTLGDNDNDVPMLACAGYGVAMGNATPAALSAANWITLPHDESGVAAAVRVLALGEELADVRLERGGRPLS